MPRRLSLVPLIALTLVIVSAGSAGVQSQASASAAQEADAFYQKRDWAWEPILFKSAHLFTSRPLH